MNGPIATLLATLLLTSLSACGGLLGPGFQGEPEGLGGPEHADRIQVLDGAVYWLDEGEGTLGRTLGDGTSEELVTDEAYPADLAIGGGTLFWGTNYRGYVASMPLDGGEITILAEDYDGATALAVDDSHVYWQSNSTGAVHRVPRSGGAAETLFESDESVFTTSVALDSGSVYWIEYSTPGWTGKIWSADHDGGNARLLAEQQDSPEHLALSETHVYWSGAGSVHFVAKSGGTVASIDPGGCYPEGIATDPDNVYWTNASSLPDCGEYSFTVRYAPLVGGETTTIAEAEDSPTSIAVDDDFVYWSAGGIFRLAR
ncbi:MAG: DUF5050 domain-containing protein [Pseudomonadota bacterium]